MAGELIDGRLVWVVPVGTARKLVEGQPASGLDAQGDRITGRVLDHKREGNRVGIVITEPGPCASPSGS